MSLFVDALMPYTYMYVCMYMYVYSNEDSPQDHIIAHIHIQQNRKTCLQHVHGVLQHGQQAHVGVDDQVRDIAGDEDLSLVCLYMYV